MGITFRHFASLSITTDDLHAKYAGQTGLWQAFAPPRRDEIRHQQPLGFYQGRFEEVLGAVLSDHGRDFIDGRSCGEIIPIIPKRVGPQ